MSVQCWPDVCNAGPTLARHWIDVLSSLSLKGYGHPTPLVCNLYASKRARNEHRLRCGPQPINTLLPDVSKSCMMNGTSRSEKTHAGHPSDPRCLVRGSRHLVHLSRLFYNFFLNVEVFSPSSKSKQRLFFGNKRSFISVRNLTGVKKVNHYSAGIYLRRQNVTYVDVKFWRLKSIPEPKEYTIYNGRWPIT